MSNIIYLTGAITYESTNKFIDEYNRLDPTVPVTMYLNSTGGETAHGQVIQDIINTTPAITLIGCGVLFSCAFNIFFGSSCPRILMPDTLGMAHYYWASLQVDEAGNYPDSYEKVLRQHMLKNKSKTIQRFKSIGLNDEEIDIIKQGDDCYFTTPRLQQLLKYAQDKAR